MQLRPAIASYSGEVYGAIGRFLDSEVLDVVAEVAQSPVRRVAIDSRIYDELPAMYVFREEGGVVFLDTAVFLEDDIEKINSAVLEIGAELASLVAEAAADMGREPPVVTNFLVGIIGIGQSLGRFLRTEGVAADWASRGGPCFRAYCARLRAEGRACPLRT